MKFRIFQILHLGKRVNEISMLEDQREILTEDFGCFAMSAAPMRC